MRQWEYLELRVHGSHDFWSDSLGRSGKLSRATGVHGGTAAVWNDLGEQGWELVAIASGDPPNQSYLAILKRPRQPNPHAESANGTAHDSHVLPGVGP